MKKGQGLSANVKLILTTVIFWLHAVFGCSVGIIAGWFLMDIGLEYNGFFIAILLSLIYLVLLITAVALAAPIETWALSLPFQLVLCALGVWVAPIPEMSGISMFGWLLIGAFDLPNWTGYLVMAVEIVAVQLLGIGIRAVCRKIKERFGGIPL